MKNAELLRREFFERSTLAVAQDLLGKVFSFNNIQGVITETEAYIGQDDPARHAAKGKTKRTQTMFGLAGYSYIYMIYGMYYCLNFVTEKVDFPAAVLIRAIEIEGVSQKSLNGPGKLCRYLGITKQHNKTDLTKSNDFAVFDIQQKIPYIATPRIGIKVGTDKLWRFVKV
ncbi:MAG: DNA-3-methyladenine glycosylase [Rickettsiales bacterium]|nr:DNA-3-methyladenine glycosylase [Rickettsiales bacterium]